MLELSWGKVAFRLFVRQWRWEGDNVGLKAAETMRQNVANSIMLIRQMPSTGWLYKKVGKRTYRIIQTHPKSSLLYWHDDKEIHIVRFIISQRSIRPY